MICPKCGAETFSEECSNCGVIISKYVVLNEKKHDAKAEPKKKIEIYIEKKPGPARAIILNLLFFLTVFIVYFAACPFITIKNIKTGIEQRDSEKLSECINFEELGTSLKKQYDARIIEGMEKTGDSQMASLTASYVSKITEPMVEAALTPEGLGNIMTGYKQLKNKKHDSQMDELEPNQKKNYSDLLLDARNRYDSLSEFSVWVTNENGKDTRIVLKRSGLFLWKLDHIFLPE